MTSPFPTRFGWPRPRESGAGYRPLHGRPEWLPSTLSDNYINTLHPSSYDTVTFAGAHEGGLFASMDCQNWGQLSGGALPPVISINDLAEGPIAADSQNRPDMYAASYDGGLIKGGQGRRGLDLGGYPG